MKCDGAGAVHRDVAALEDHAGGALIELELLVGGQLVGQLDVLVFVLLRDELLLAIHLAAVVAAVELRDHVSDGLVVRAGRWRRR